MSRVLDFGDAGHRRTELDLPWYVNGSLDAAACERIERHLAGCARCRSEADELRQFQHRYAAVTEPATAPPDFAPLRRRIEAEAVASPPVQPRSGGPAWLRWAMAAQVFALAMLAAWVLRSEVRVGSYRTLGAERAPSAGVAAGSHRALLMFESTLPQAQMRLLLQANGTRIVDGPNEAGAWLVVLPETNPAQALRALRAAPGVALAESVDPEPGR